MRFDVIRDGRVLSPAHILTNVRDAFLNTAGHVIPAVSHAANYGRKVGLAIFGILTCAAWNTR